MSASLPVEPARLHLLWDERTRPGDTALARAAARLLGGGLLVCADLADPLPALNAIVAARRRGEATALYPILADPREAIVGEMARAALEKPAAERLAMERAIASPATLINGRPLERYADVADDHRRLIYAALRSADLVVVASHAARRRFETIVGRELGATWVVPLAVAAAPPRNGPIVVDGRGMRRSGLSFVDLALVDMRTERRDLADDVPGDAAAAIAEAGVVVAPSWHDAGIALGDASSGAVVVAPDTTGIDEMGGIVYDPRDARSLRRAVARARVAGAAEGRRFAAPPYSAATLPSGGPVLSVVVRTFNRPALLQDALESLAVQHYRSLEAVVVNDAGVDVADVVAGFAGRLTITYVPRATNGGLVVAANDGVAAASGTYVGYLDDDDTWFPDHGARLVDALERTGAVAAYGNALAVYYEPSPDGERVYDYAVYTDRDFERSDLLVRNVSTVHAVVHRRDAWERLGGFDVAFPACDDWDMWLRMADLGDFVHVDRVTVEYAWRFDPAAAGMSQTKLDAFARAHQMMTEKHAARYAGHPEAARVQRAVASDYRERGARDAAPSRPVPPLPDR